MPHNNHHRCARCGRDFSNRLLLDDHVKRRHPREDALWWVAAERPNDLPFEY
ncbi:MULTISPECIES: hypothetical protein [unclassified Haladaptatus]|jgi:hypothetical protein|uniref:hypothetical protein n=1 Tax=unclassified Haladaptatus TaxID=2622732 RepID=UPI002FCDF131